MNNQCKRCLSDGNFDPPVFGFRNFISGFYQGISFPVRGSGDVGRNRTMDNENFKNGFGPFQGQCVVVFFFTNRVGMA